MKSPFVLFCYILTMSSLGSCLSQDTIIAENTAAKDTSGIVQVSNTDPAPGSYSNVLDTALFNAKIEHMVNGDSSGKWPVKTPYPLPGAILPFKTIIAYYGNLYSKQMGILGEFPRKQMLRKLQDEMDRWKKADPSLELQPALHYIAVTAQLAPGKAGKYRLRMPFHQIDSVLMVDRGIPVTRQNKFRNQRVVLTIYVPVGRQIRVDKSVGWSRNINLEGPWHVDLDDIQYEGIECGWEP